MKISKEKHISIIGGAGHVGLPLGLAFAAKSYKVHLIDKNKNYLNLIKNNHMPFLKLVQKKYLKKLINLNPFIMKLV